MPNSGSAGAPILRTTSTSSGAPRARATSDRDRHAAAGKGDDERPLPDEAIEQDGEAAPRVSAVVEDHASIVLPARRPAICARPDGPGVFPKVFRHERAGTAG